MLILSVKSLILLTFCLSNCAGLRLSGPINYIRINDFGPCKTDNKDVDLSMYLRILDDETRELDVNFTLPFDLDNNVKYSLSADKYNSGRWDKDAFKTNGNTFHDVKQMIPKLWKHIRAAVVPKIEDENMIPAGSYTLKNFRDVAASMSLPQILYGRLRVHANIIKNDEIIACMNIQLDSFE